MKPFESLAKRIFHALRRGRWTAFPPAAGDLDALQPGVPGSPAGTAPDEDLLQLRAAVRGQEIREASPLVLSGLLDRLDPLPRPKTARLTGSWAAAMALVVLAMALLWQTLPPGIQLQWTVDGAPLDGFRIYRAEAGSEEFVLVEELEYLPEAAGYRFIDLFPAPGQAYIYRVEAVGPLGSPVASQSLAADGTIALAGQIALALTVLLLLFGGLVLARRMPGAGGPAAPLGAL